MNIAIAAIAFFALLAVPLAGLGYVLVKEHRKQGAWIQRTRRILAEGRPATAVVTAMGPASLGKFVFTIHLDVQLGGEREFSAMVEALVPPYASGAFAPGKRVAVRYVLAERAVAIDFPAMGYAPPPGW